MREPRKRIIDESKRSQPYPYYFDAPKTPALTHLRHRCPRYLPVQNHAGMDQPPAESVQ